MTGASHAPVDGRQGKALADTDPIASPCPPSQQVETEKSVDLEMDGREDFENLLCLWAAALKQIPLRKGCRSRRILRMWVLPATEKDGRGFRRSRIPPRRAQCSFDGSAVKSAFSLLLAKVTKPAAAAAKGISIKLPQNWR